MVKFKITKWQNGKMVKCQNDIITTAINLFRSTVKYFCHSFEHLISLNFSIYVKLLWLMWSMLSRHVILKDVLPQRWNITSAGFPTSLTLLSNRRERWDSGLCRMPLGVGFYGGILRRQHFTVGGSTQALPPLLQSSNLFLRSSVKGGPGQQITVGDPTGSSFSQFGKFSTFSLINTEP